MGVKEAAGKGAWRKRYLKEYMPHGVVAHLAVQPSRYSQRLLAAVGKEARTAPWGLVEWEKGKTIESLAGTPFLLRNRRRILDQLADALAEHLRAGIVHGDLHGENVVVSKTRSKRAPVKVKIIDYAFAKALTREAMERHEEIHGFFKRQFAKAVERGEINKESGREYMEERRMERVITDDYPSVVEHVIPALAKNMKDREKLRKYFERKFLEKVKKGL